MIAPPEDWHALDAQPPQAVGYYRMRDSQAREGVAFRHRNHTWTVVAGPAQKPYTHYREIR